MSICTIGSLAGIIDDWIKDSTIIMKLRNLLYHIGVEVHKVVNHGLFTLSVSIVFILVASLYHYGLLCEYPPNAEDLTTISVMFSHLTLGTEYQIGEILHCVCAYIATKIGGMTYFSIRLFFTMLYAILLSTTVYLCLSFKKGQKNKLYLLSLIGLFVVLLFPAADNPVMFWYSGGEGLAYLWPFVYHYGARICTLACLVWLWLMMRCRGKKGQVIYGVLLAVTCLYAMMRTDLIFYAMFLAPAVIVLLLHLMQKDELRKYAVFLFIGGMLFLLFSRILPIGMIKQLWTKDSVASVYSSVYGGTNWITYNALGEHLLSYIEVVFLDFNIQILGAPVISLHSFVYLLKIGILLSGYIVMFHIIICSLTGKTKKYQYDCVDEITAWSYLVLSGIYIFTELGHPLDARYFPGFTVMMTILLCRNLEVLPEICKIDILRRIQHKKILFCICTFILCACSAGQVWADRAPNQFDDELMAMVEYIQGTGFGHVLAPHWIYSRVSALSEGKVMAYEDMDEIKDVYGEDARIAYIITHSDEYWYDNAITFYNHCETYEDMCEYYSEPTNVIRYNKLQLAVYEDGILVAE